MKLISLLSPQQTLKVINFWPPFLFSGLSVIDVNDDVTSITARKKISFYNQNYFGTHFGGSLYAMCDPFYAFILLHHLGKDHVVWDKGAEIDFVKATRATVTSRFSITKEHIEDIRQQCLQSFKVEPVFAAEVKDAEGMVIATVKKRLYVRRKDAKQRFKTDEC